MQAVQSKTPLELKTKLTDMLGIRYPIIGAPMFLVSNVEMVVAISEAGGIGTIPSLNFRPASEFSVQIKKIKSMTKKPVGVNIIVNKSNNRQIEDTQSCLDAGVELIISSLGNPKQLIADAHKSGSKVLCDVTNLEHALRVQDLGADGVIAVSSGAGGHAGPISPFILVPWLKEKLSIPVIAAGGIADGHTMAAAMALGADGVNIGTRFIASEEAKVSHDYKEAIVKATPEDIIMTTRISGTPVAVIRTPDVEKMGLDLPWYLDVLKKNKTSKKYVVPLIHWLGMHKLEKSAQGTTWKKIWSAGQSVGLIHEILSCDQIIKKIISEYAEAKAKMP